MRYLVAAVMTVVWALGCGNVVAMESVQIVCDAPDSRPIQYAVGALRSALIKVGITVAPSGAESSIVPVRVVAGIAGRQGELDRLLDENALSVPPDAESLLIRKVQDKGGITLLLAGRDERGLVFALREAAAGVASADKGADPWSAVLEGSESPALKLRSISMHLLNADLERDWYFSEEFWRQYFSMLVGNRFNTFILRFADQTNYMAPPYPWLFDLADYPEVGVEGLGKEEQARNLAMLRRIGELATDYGLDFALAIWQQKPVLEENVPFAPYTHNYGPSALKNLPADEKLVDYGTKALARLLQECPAIKRLQLRINYESGIAEAIQPRYFSELFSVLKSQSRPIQLDLRYKGLNPSTVDQAVAAGLDVTISTKFWCEHLGLPFHPTTQDPMYSASRYGYGTLLRTPRKYKVAYQLWNQGSSRLMIWGDPAYAARFTESCASGDGDGFEVFAPLTNRGWGNEPGVWRILARPELEYYRWESERYWLFYLSFGRMGYNPRTAPRVVTREFAARFGAAAEAMELACRRASQVLPFVTATTMTSASEWSYWPEMDLCGSLELYSVVPPSDHGQFYGIRAWKALPGWLHGSWSSRPNGFVEEALSGDVEAKWTPVQISRELDRLAEEALAALELARQKVVNPEDAEFRATAVDIQALAWLARYHAAKKRAALHLAFFHATQEPGRLLKVREHAEAACRAWGQLVQVTDGIYSDNLVFGRSREEVGTRAKPVNAHAGHWKDRLLNVKADVDFANALIAKHNVTNLSFRQYPGEVPPAQLPVIHHTPVVASPPDRDIVIEAQVESEQPLRKVLLRFRPMDQTKAWTVITMQETGRGQYRAVIPHDRFDATYDLLYYLEARVEGGGTLWPDWREQAPYINVKIQR